MFQIVLFGVRKNSGSFKFKKHADYWGNYRLKSFVWFSINFFKRTSFVLSIFEILSLKRVDNKVLLTGDKVMPELDLQQPRLTYSPCELLKIQKTN